jgi:hypothetical protein
VNKSGQKALFMEERHSRMRLQMPSTAIAFFNYDRDHAVLTVTFTTGRRYKYYRVSSDVVTAFRHASSKGAFFNQRIRDRYRYEEVTAAA